VSAPYRDLPGNWPGVDDLELPESGWASADDQFLERAYVQAASLYGPNDLRTSTLAAEIDRRHPSSDGIPDRLKEPGALLAGAIWYARRGIPVFPLAPNSKIPRKGSAGFKDASTDEEQVAAWWEREPASNIGAATGVRFDVLDVDGPAAWPAVFATELEIIGRSRTARPGGWHLFLPVSGNGNRARIAGVPLDLRGRGGYVLLPPSQIDGRFYHWIDPLELP
jgi:hypothetical protein